MFSRSLAIPVLLAASVGVPYVASNGPNWGKLWEGVPSDAKESSPGSASQPTGLDGLAALGRGGTFPPQGPGKVLYPTTTPLEGIPSLSLHEVFRMDVDKAWVYQRWARKSTGLSELGLYGIRVPLVTGTKLHDLAGSLTYFFGEDGRMQRISFHGRTGDTTQLVMLLVQRYGLQRQSTVVVGEQLFQVRRKDDVFSEFRTRPAPVLWASSPHDSFTVDLELQRVDATTPLPTRLLGLPEMPDIAQPTAAQQATPPPQEVAEKPSTTDETATSKEPEQDEVKGWKAFFPRSRVPSEQVDSLEKRSRFW